MDFGAERGRRGPAGQAAGRGLAERRGQAGAGGERKKKSRRWRRPAFYGLGVYPAELQDGDFFSLRAFLAACLDKADALPFRQGFESLA